MVKRILLATTLLATSPALAQSFPKPQDVPAFSQQAPVLDTSGGLNYPVDSTVTPMPVGSGLTNIPIPSNSGRIVTTPDQTESHITGSISGTTLNMTGLTSGPAPRNGDFIYGSGIGLELTSTDEQITSIVSGWNGSSGTYTVNHSASIGSEALVSTPLNFCLTVPFGGPCGENKVRTLVGDCHILPDDPIRNSGQPGQSHVHQFFGNCSTNANSTYKSMRQHALNSSAAGTDANGTGYWRPCLEDVNPFGDGKNYCIKANYTTVYYTENPARDGTGYGRKAPLPVGLRYVFGFDMDATWDSVNQVPVQYAWLQSYLDSANATIHHTRYTLTNGGRYNSQVLYTCVGATPTSVNTLATTAGGDPYGGTCEVATITASISGNTLTVTAASGASIKAGFNLSGAGVNTPTGNSITIASFGTGTGGTGTYILSNSLTVASETMHAGPEFNMNINAPSCYDGTNLWSPGGYKHVIPMIFDNDQGLWVCPKNYYGIPNLINEVHLTQYGWADRQHWDLSSDIAFRAKYSLTKAQLPPGTTYHTDWMMGWDNNILLTWEHNCAVVEHHTGHQCDSSQISATQYLQGGISGESGVTRSPQVPQTILEHFVSTDPGFEPLPSAWSGGMTNMVIKH